MTTLTKSNDRLLRTALRSNMLFSLITGAIATIAPRSVGDVIGGIPSMLIMVTGILLIAYAAILFWTTSQPEISPKWAWFAIVNDVAWVFGSIILLLVFGSIFTAAGKWIVAIIADIIAAFAIAQYIGLRRIKEIS